LVTNGKSRLVVQRLKVEPVRVVVLEPTAKFGIAVEPTGLRLTVAEIGVEDPATELAVGCKQPLTTQRLHVLVIGVEPPAPSLAMDPDGVRKALAVPHAVAPTAVTASSAAERIDPAFVVMVLAFR